MRVHHHEEEAEVTRARVEVLRDGAVESAHAVHVAVCASDGALVGRAGDADRAIFARSAIKPFQALPLVEDGAVQALGMRQEELALCCASHNAEDAHVATAAAILKRAGARETFLACGPHPPYFEAAARALARRGEEPRAIHNNCSGKHAGMLALCRHNGWRPQGYHLPDHPVQERVQRVLEEWSGVAASTMTTATDGCGVVTFGLPLRGLAAAFARLAAASRDDESSPAGQVVGAMVSHPFHVAGTGRLCTELMAAARGRVFAKTGAEGVYGAGVPELGLGVALKVEDGNKRASEPMLLAVLAALDAVGRNELSGLGAWAQPEVKNTRGDVVGQIRVELELERFDG